MSEIPEKWPPDGYEIAGSFRYVWIEEDGGGYVPPSKWDEDEVALAQRTVE